MYLLHEDATHIFHRPILHNGRIIKANGFTLVSRSHPNGSKAGAAVDRLLTDVLADTKATERPPDIILNPELIEDMCNEMGGMFFALWLGSGPELPTVVRCEHLDAFAVLMPVKAQSVGALNITEDSPEPEDKTAD